MSSRGNPKWKDGATERRQKHAAKAFYRMRPMARERDQFKCVVCASSTARLEVHHLDEDPTNNALSNLVTLCSQHHRQWHAAKDRKPSTILWPWLKTYAATSQSMTFK